MATLRQIAANRLNSTKSTGPVSDEGKGRSRRNALKHGLAGEGVVLPDEEADAVEARASAWRDSFRPAGDEDEWLFQQAVVNSVRVDRCQRHEVELRTHLAARASLTWADDRRLDAEETAASLARDPARVSRRLCRTTQGCDWLLERWRALALIFQANGAWTEAQNALALDMLGTPRELRGLLLPVMTPAATAEGEIARLERLQAEGLDDLDAHAQAASEAGLEIETGRPLALLRRYEAACLRQFQWARDRLRKGKNCPTQATPDPEPQSQPHPFPTPPSPSPAPADEPRWTDADWREDGRSVIERVMPSAPPVPKTPEPVERELPACLTGGRPVRLDTPPPRPNRQARRAAEKRSRQS